MTSQPTHNDFQVVNAKRRDEISKRLGTLPAALYEGIGEYDFYAMSGRVTKVVGTIIYAIVSDVQVGEIVELYTRSSGAKLLAEVVGFLDREALLSPIGETQGVAPKNGSPSNRTCAACAGWGRIKRPGTGRAL